MDILFDLFLIVMGMIGGAWFLWAWMVWPINRIDRAHHLSGDEYLAARERHPTRYGGPAAMDEF